jgi:methylated-DNA-[protein]-cysteine S-methyltransferase
VTEKTIDAHTTGWTRYESPLGPLTLAGLRGVPHRVYLPNEVPQLAARGRDAPGLAEARSQLEQYFEGERRTFELALEPHGDELQREVWRALLRIPYGETTTYGAIARELGVGGTAHDPPARIVGGAIGRTPIPIVIPCHRVVAADGALTGYRGGLELKRALLDFEASGGEPAALEHDWQRDQLSLL